MDSLELGLKIFVNLESVSHILIVHEFVWNLERNQKLSRVCLSLEVRKAGKKPEQDMVKGLLLSVDDITHKVWIEVARIAKNFQETTNAFFSFLLSLLLHVDSKVDIVELSEDFVDKFEEFKWRLVIEFNHAEVAHKWRLVETIHDYLDLSGIQIRRLAE